MGQKVEVGGTGRDLKGGKTLIGGTAYAIKKGRTLKGGTGYDIKLGNSLTWLLNKTIDVNTNFSVDIGFTRATTHFNRIFCTYPEWGSGRSLVGRPDEVTSEWYGWIFFMNGIWYENGTSMAETSDATYRTLTFDEEPTGDLLTWLQANGTQI